MAGNSHGHTLAAWTGVTIATIGFLISGVCTVAVQPIGFVAGMIVVVIGGIVGWAMKGAGYGQPTAKGLLMESGGSPQAAAAGANGQSSQGNPGKHGTSADGSAEDAESQPQGQSS